MDLDFKAIGVAVAAILTATGTIVTGIYTGRNALKKDATDAEKVRNEARLAREAAEDAASRQRVEDIARDLRETRRRVDQNEREFDARAAKLARERDRWSDLARYHYDLVITLSHLLNNLFLTYQLGHSSVALHDAVGMAMERMKAITIPKSVEEPMPPEDPLTQNRK